jgi:hypothetical protein
MLGRHDRLLDYKLPQLGTNVRLFRKTTCVFMKSIPLRY